MDGATQPRAELNQAHLEELVELLRDGGTFKDPVVVFYDGTNHWLADGFHRINATKLAGLDTVEADVRSGLLVDAIEFSCGANATHGLRRTNGDKRRAVDRLLSLPKWQVKSNREIARQCGVTEGLVRIIKSDLPSNHPCAYNTQNTMNQPEKPVEGVEKPRLAEVWEDKRKTVRDFLAQPDSVGLSNVAIAEKCGVDEKLVRKIKKELQEEEELAAQEVLNLLKAVQEPATIDDSREEDESEPEPIETIADPVTEIDEPATLDDAEEDDDHDYGDEKNEEEVIPHLRYSCFPTYPARCKHCGETHFDWSLDEGDWWFCGKCNLATNDEFMQIDKNYKAPAIPEPEQPIESHTVVRPDPEPEPVVDTATPVNDILHAFISDEPVDCDALTETMLDMAKAIHEQEAQEAPAPAVVSTDDEEEENQQQILNSAGVPVATPHILSRNNEWYTPAKYVDAARELMGTIDLDPASCESANETIKATRYYDKQTNGFDKPWNGHIWLNPPYGREDGSSNQEAWSRRLIEQYQDGITQEAILLVNAAVDTKWFQRLFDYPICFPHHRINFTTPEPTASGSTHGSALIYFGPKPQEFARIFSQFGVIVQRYQAC
jgi:hypothetical protein